MSTLQLDLLLLTTSMPVALSKSLHRNNRGVNPIQITAGKATRDGMLKLPSLRAKPKMWPTPWLVESTHLKIAKSVSNVLSISIFDSDTMLLEINCASQLCNTRSQISYRFSRFCDLLRALFLLHICRDVANFLAIRYLSFGNVKSRRLISLMRAIGHTIPQLVSEQH